ncbi:hypothetical protein K3495_g14432 [Podosphaera aphanis]|nr:hypothetical protein K3495_g14432 [Podosphaera aphanis]
MPHFEPTLASAANHHEDGTEQRQSNPNAVMSSQLRIKNRRKLFLDANPSYFTSNDVELAEPILFDKCIRRFQTPDELAADKQKKGYIRTLESDLWRIEAEAIALKERITATYTTNQKARATVPSAAAFEDGDPRTREEGWEKWKYVMTLRFLKGEDSDFDYRTVDENEEWDWLERKELEEAWFDNEEPSEMNVEREGNRNTGIQDF